jgi:radical SAM protein with 4Fe4S-binding SPASM domain
MREYRLRELKIEVNRDCPLHCLHCSSNGMPGAPERLDPPTILRIIKEFVDLGGEKLCISGGEPLCYQELSNVISICRGKNIDLSLYTTGIARNGGPSKPVSEKMAFFLAEQGVKVIFSIHGANEKTHDTLTQVKGSFFRTLAAIEKTIKAGALVELHVVPTAMNFKELVDIARLADSVGVKKISWLRFVPQGRGYLNRKVLQLSKEQLKALTSKKAEVNNTCPNISIRTGAPFNILCPQLPAPCEAGISVLTIIPDGSISPCDAFKRFDIPDKFGNVLRASLAEVWQNSLFLNTVRALHESSLNSSCSSCAFYPRCNSGCLAQKAIVAGALTDGKDPCCPLGEVEVVRDEVKAITV